MSVDIGDGRVSARRLTRSLMERNARAAVVGYDVLVVTAGVVVRSGRGEEGWVSERASECVDVCVVAQGRHANAWVVVRECGEDYTPCSRWAEACVMAVAVEVRWRSRKRGGRRG